MKTLQRLGAYTFGLFVICCFSLIVSSAFAPARDLNRSDQTGLSIGNANSKAIVGKTGSLATTLTTADQVIVTYTVTGGKTLYLESVNVFSRLTTMAATATNFGSASLETPSGTKIATVNLAGGAGASQWAEFDFAEPIPIAAGTVVRLVCTPSATTAFTFQGNLLGYER